MPADKPILHQQAWKKSFRTVQVSKRDQAGAWSEAEASSNLSQGTM
jgi:hypothetical protein